MKIATGQFSQLPETEKNSPTDFRQHVWGSRPELKAKLDKDAFNGKLDLDSASGYVFGTPYCAGAELDQRRVRSGAGDSRGVGADGSERHKEAPHRARETVSSSSSGLGPPKAEGAVCSVYRSKLTLAFAPSPTPTECPGAAAGGSRARSREMPLCNISSIGPADLPALANASAVSSRIG